MAFMPYIRRIANFVQLPRRHTSGALSTVPAPSNYPMSHHSLTSPRKLPPGRNALTNSFPHDFRHQLHLHQHRNPTSSRHQPNRYLHPPSRLWICQLRLPRKLLPRSLVYLLPSPSGIMFTASTLTLLIWNLITTFRNLKGLWGKIRSVSITLVHRC